ncbi:DUF6262 family protein [Pseudonocardia sp. GCM10023141]|uniref:DUF6262 family protein n=1 Tax=Pseudonocardia sp. GCM10023141 TaxID=3252653 RepID=UPI00361FF237
MRADNSAHLHASAARRREQTLQRARDALHQLENDGGPVTFDLVARTAGVSRSWLYTEPSIWDAIQRLRAAHRPSTNNAVPASQRASDASLLRRLEAAHTRNRELAAEIRQLREQLARAHGQLRATRLTAPAASASDVSNYRAIPTERAARNQQQGFNVASALAARANPLHALGRLV